MVIVRQLLQDRDTRFHDLGTGFYDTHHNTSPKRRNHVRQLEALGYTVTLETAA